MIKAAITDAETPLAGELMRLLINHPEVEITTLLAPGMNGRPVTASHHGFIGENIVNFSDRIDPSSLDVIFVTGNTGMSVRLMQRSEEWPELRIIDLSPDRFPRFADAEFEYGLSEINRKALVRGARFSALPTTAASLALIALYPLATFLLLPEEITLDISAPEDMVKNINDGQLEEEISSQLRKVQNSFQGKIKIRKTANSSSRGIKMVISFKSLPSLEEIAKIYDDTYDDHNFTFTTVSEISDNETEGTQKCVITYKKNRPDILELDVTADARMRGGAGDAVHVMNLLFSLYEKTGLTLKPSRFGNSTPVESAEKSWFA